MSGPLAVVGSANVDLVFRTAQFPGPGETVLGSEFTTFMGGKGANQAVAAARLGADVVLIGRVGADAYGSAIIKSLLQSGVETTYLREIEAAPTGVAGIVVSDSGENSIVVVSGANWHLHPDEIKTVLEDCSPPIVLTQFEIREESASACAGDHMLIVNPAPARAFEGAFGQAIGLLTPNRSEAEHLTGIRPVDDRSCWECANVLFAKGVKNVVITLGAEGAFFATPRSGRRLPTLSVRVVDTTGAGDAFNGALAAFLLEGREIDNAVLLANAAAAISTTRRGAQASMASLAELKEVAGRLF